MMPPVITAGEHVSDIRDPLEAERLERRRPRRAAYPPGLPPAHRGDRGAGGRRSGWRSTPTRSSPRRHERQRRAADPLAAQPPDRHVRRADDGEPLVRPLPRLAAGRRRAPGRACGSPTRQGQRSRPTGCVNNYQGCGFLDPDHSWDGGRTEMDGGRMDGFLRAAERRVLDRLLRRAGPAVHPARGQGVHRVRPLLLLAAGLHVSQPRVHARGPVLRDDGQLAAVLAERQLGFPDTTIFHALSQAKGVSNRYFYTDIPVSALWGSARDRALEPGPDLLRAGGDRHAAGAVVRRPRVQRRGPGHLGRRAPARRRPRRPGVRRRRRPRVPGVAAVQARRAVHRLRRVGRVLRPRRPAARARPARQPRPQQGLRPDGLADPGGGRLAVRAPRLRRPLDLRVRVDPEDDPLPLRAGAADPARPVREQHRRRVRLGVKARLHPPALPTPAARHGHGVQRLEPRLERPAGADADAARLAGPLACATRGAPAARAPQAPRPRRR